MYDQYKELCQRLEQIVETIGQIVSTQEENNRQLGEQIDTLKKIVWLEGSKKVQKKA